MCTHTHGLFTHANICQPTHNKRTNTSRNLLISPANKSLPSQNVSPSLPNPGQEYSGCFTAIKCYYIWEKWETVKILVQIKTRSEKNEPAYWGRRNEGLRLSANRKKVLKIRWVRNWEGKTIRHRCGLITVKRSGHRIITAGPHRRGGQSRWKQKRGGEREVRKQSITAKTTKKSFSSTYEQTENVHHFLDGDNCTHTCTYPPRALNIITNADCSSYENTAFHANCLSKEMLWHDSQLELQGGVISEG